MENVQEKEANMVVCVKALKLNSSSIASEGRRTGPAFLGVNMFGSALAHDVAACSGGEAKVMISEVGQL